MAQRPGVERRPPARPAGESRRARSESRFRVPDESQKSHIHTHGVPDESVHPAVPKLPSEFASKLTGQRHYHEAEALLASQPWRLKPVQTPRTGWEMAQPEELVRRLRHGSPEEKAG